MRKLIISLLALGLLSVGSIKNVQAETSVMNFFKGIANGAAGAVYCILATPNNVYKGAKANGIQGAITGFGDFTRAAPKAVEELAYGITLQETGRSVTDPGILNENIESNVFTHSLRNGVGTWFTTAGVASSTGSSWTSTTQAANWVAIPVTVGTIVNH